MSQYNRLPGFNAWLTYNPFEEEHLEPSARIIAEARDQIADMGGPMPTDEEVYTLACMLAANERKDMERNAEEAEADSLREDREEVGDGP
jgi:hypothetical protein